MKAVLVFILFIFTLASCTPQPDENLKSWMEPSDKIRVLSTTAMVDALVKEIGGDEITRLTLVKGELDPHSYQLVKGDDEKLARADIIFCSGLGLEHGPSLRASLMNSSKAICLGDEIKKTSPNAIIYLQKTPDPHLWMDMNLWAEGIPFIVKALSEKDPTHAHLYKARGDAFAAKLKQEHLLLQQALLSVPEEERYLVTSHDAFNYFTRAYLATEAERSNGGWQKRFAAPEGLAPESQLSASDIRLILNYIKQHNIKIIFPESNISQASIRKLHNAGTEEGLKLVIATTPLYGDAMGAANTPGDTYLKMIRHNVETIKRYLTDAGASHDDSTK